MLVVESRDPVILRWQGGLNWKRLSLLNKRLTVLTFDCCMKLFLLLVLWTYFEVKFIRKSELFLCGVNLSLCLICRSFADKLDRTILYDCDTRDPMCTTRKGVIKILRALEHYPICLSLLEASPLPKQIARLVNHENKRISQLARRIRTNWQACARNALDIAQEFS